METLTPLFHQHDWHFSSKSSNNNKFCYKKTNPYDEFSIEILPTSNQIITIVPVNDVHYKKTFINMTTAIEYIKMHLNYYQSV